ncbi:MAG: glutathione S-transferase family protein [Rhodospirillales bacterium]|nr:glutathione S-transferase family protein [Rhodospirillales bacterium]
MGQLVDGEWHKGWIDTKSTGGRFERKDSVCRNWVTPDGSAGPTGVGGFKAERGRYHLYVADACPWAHRAVLMRRLKGLDDAIDVSVVNEFMGENGWTFDDDGGGSTGDALFGSRYLYEVYLKSNPEHSGRVTVPVLWDKDTGTIVSNESSEVIRMLNSAFNDVGATGPDYYPEGLRAEIDPLNERIYHTVNNGVYRCGFATTQSAYDDAARELFDTLDMLEDRLSIRRYLMGEVLTEADWRLFATLARFDPVYVGHFKCNLRRLVDYPNLWGYTRELYQMPGIADTIRMEHVRGHYYRSHESINPSRIVPIGPDVDFTQPHGRETLSIKSA